jgi:regulator of replication initiation timing
MSSRARSSTRDDFDKVKDVAHKLRSENRRLRKENSRLRKELNRYVEVEVDDVEVDAEYVAVIEKPEVINCPKCKADDFKQIPAGKYTVNLCKACGYRKRQESNSR